MKSYNYKCVVAKNGVKMYYKRVGGKWKRVSNKIGEKAEKGKRKYRVDDERREAAIRMFEERGEEVRKVVQRGQICGKINNTIFDCDDETENVCDEKSKKCVYKEKKIVNGRKCKDRVSPILKEDLDDIDNNDIFITDDGDCYSREELIGHVKKLLTQGFDINALTEEGTTPIHVASYYDKLDILEYLILEGGDPYIVDNLGNTILHYAVVNKNLDIILYILKNLEMYKVNVKNEDGDIPLKIFEEWILQPVNYLGIPLVDLYNFKEWLESRASHFFRTFRLGLDSIIKIRLKMLGKNIRSFKIKTDVPIDSLIVKNFRDFKKKIFKIYDPSKSEYKKILDEIFTELVTNKLHIAKDIFEFVDKMDESNFTPDIALKIVKKETVKFVFDDKEIHPIEIYKGVEMCNTLTKDMVILLNKINEENIGRQEKFEKQTNAMKYCIARRSIYQYFYMIGRTLPPRYRREKYYKEKEEKQHVFFINNYLSVLNKLKDWQNDEYEFKMNPQFQMFMVVNKI